MNLTLAFDAGTSGSKVLAYYQSPNYHRPEDRLFLLGPAVRPLMKETYEELEPNYQATVGTPNDGIVSYHNVLQKEQVYCQLGREASMPGFLPVQDPKLTTYVAKILIVVGYLACYQLSTTDEISLNLGCLLPFNEWADRDLLEQLLRGVFSGDGFLFNGKPVPNVRLQSLEIQPEGYGISYYYLSDITNVLMMGQRDSAWLSFNTGKISLIDSLPLPKSGMHSFIKTMMQQYRVDDELKMSQLISAAGPKMRPKMLKPLTATGSEAEIKQLQRAISTTKAQFWMERSRIFQGLNATSADRVYISGGCSYYFAAELTQIFKARGVRLDWCKTLISEFDQRYPGHQKTRLPYRMIDAYAFYSRLPEVPKFSVKKAEVATRKTLSILAPASAKTSLRSTGGGGFHV